MAISYISHTTTVMAVQRQVKDALKHRRDDFSLSGRKFWSVEVRMAITALRELAANPPHVLRHLATGKTARCKLKIIQKRNAKRQLANLAD